MAKLRIATCQFAISGNIRRNATQIKRQIAQAKKQRAQVVHLPEAALSGYAGVDVESWDGYDWDTLRRETEAICDLAAKSKVWVILGSAHPLSGRHKPHNCLYVINADGQIVDRYDKCFCTGADLKHYSPGDHLVTLDIHGVRCGLLICYDLRFPELYRAYRKQGVECLFDSFYNARATGPGIHTIIMRPTLQAHAATNYFWISANNASGHYQSWQSVFIRPDGVIARSLKRNQAGVMVNTVDTDLALYDASKPYRDRAMKGNLHSGTLVKDARSRDRQGL
ncbi:MAG: carbon-nitrogen hydrolase family protein [Gemmatimonadetes bacterium]|jgi:deaminated glutathione amidase|nr:carbon-nitrogen hydrolase family protein [Gemmatimonadota bacterium]MBT6148240.1 carbon-nitrogen hydrolase family protein [Gemmatimonadota bacterium]MBT7859005.1 carbon-nitrogen hydrolase family protein [Gemmatimonadota bacterium]